METKEVVESNKLITETWVGMIKVDAQKKVIKAMVYLLEVYYSWKSTLTRSIVHN